MSILGTIAMLLVAFLAALLVAPLFDRKTARNGGEAAQRRVVLTRGIAVAYIVIASASTIYRLAQTLTAPSLVVKMPVEEFWPSLPSGSTMTGVSATVLSGGFTQALVEVEGLAANTRWLLASTSFLQGVAAIFIGAAVVSMCNGYITKATFRPVLIRWFTAAAVVILVCGLGWQLTESLAGMQASEQVLSYHGSSFQRDAMERESLQDIIGIPTPVYLDINFNLWPLWAGLGLFTTAQIFRRGLEMQKDTAGLV
ncbi:hypothetical protein CQ018_02940 [Arthrobacter sp. MYb227]|uniref:hypothetical protein n=1 Tax=Arthrobacter sp. MYb227 TaxID=1848601 RepID=UPI000CFCF40F|nr:hypothetical protein [Arthrobacter sp. MYb227]PQZ96247.1 hypothetical protein CQ018_02940 [Arthrobacter sp. MYb227]